MNFIIFVLSKYKTKLLAANHLITKDRTKFDIEQKSSKFLLEIMTHVPLANIGSDKQFILSHLYIYIMNIQTLELILGEFPISMYSSQRKNSDMN